MATELRLLVLRTDKLPELLAFYTDLGLEFEYHRHGTGPYHYSAALGTSVFEMYPLGKGQSAPDAYLQLGFTVDDFDGCIKYLKEKNTVFVSEPAHTEFGYMVVVKDPDGRNVEIYNNENSTRGI